MEVIFETKTQPKICWSPAVPSPATDKLSSRTLTMDDLYFKTSTNPTIYWRPAVDSDATNHLKN